MMFKRIEALLKSCHTDLPFMPPTQLYNEGWMLRLTVDRLASTGLERKQHPLVVPPGCRWYSEAPGTLHHVMVRGIEGRNIFQDEEDRKAFVDRMGNLVEETGTRILAWALMDNHIHLLIISGSAGLSTFMRRLLTGYAYGFNRKYRRFGHIFQNR